MLVEYQGTNHIIISSDLPLQTSKALYWYFQSWMQLATKFWTKKQQGTRNKPSQLRLSNTAPKIEEWKKYVLLKNSFLTGEKRLTFGWCCFLDRSYHFFFRDYSCFFKSLIPNHVSTIRTKNLSWIGLWDWVKSLKLLLFTLLYQTK